MGNIKKDVFLGNKEKQNKKFELLAKMAQPEIWTYKKIKDKDPYRILRNYFFFTYNRLSEENKILTSEDGEYRCMNTGLLTIYDQEIIALFKKSSKEGGFPWYLVGFFRETDKEFTTHFSQIPELASYFDNVKDLIYDSSLELSLKKEHIIDDNIDRFMDAGLVDKRLISVLLDAAKATLEKKLKRNFKLALPFYYHNTDTDESKIQLLAPLYFPGAPVKPALVINKVKSDANEYYEGITILPVEWAYMNSRLIVRPDEEWARIIDEIDAQPDEISTQDSIDKDE